MTASAFVPHGAAVPSLPRWGLSSDADLVFRTLTTFGPRSPRTLATELGLPRQRIVSALGELRECRAALGDRGPDAVWTARPAAEVVQRLRTLRMRSPDPAGAARRHRAAAALLTTALAEAGFPADPVIGGTAADGVRYLPDRPLTRRRLATVMSQERHDHLVINTEEVLNADISRSAPIDDEVFARGIRYRVLSRPPLDGDATDPNVSPEHRIASAAYRYRETLDTPIKLFVCDRRTAFVPADPADVNRGYLEISQPEVVRALVSLFESRWDAAVDPSADGVPVVALSARERDLVALLATGHTDVTAARELRISARSVTNTLRAMMDRLGVDNRFQLGLALGALRVTVPPSLAASVENG